MVLYLDRDLNCNQNEVVILVGIVKLKSQLMLTVVILDKEQNNNMQDDERSNYYDNNRSIMRYCSLPINARDDDNCYL